MSKIGNHRVALQEHPCYEDGFGAHARARAARQAIIDDVGGWRGNGDPRNRVVAYLPEPDPIDTIRTAVERIRAQLSAINEAMRLLKPLFGLMFLVWLGALWVGCHD